MIFTLPLPPTTNNMYGFRGYKRFPSEEYKAWREEAGTLINMQKKSLKTILGEVYVGIAYFLKRKRDIDNGKAICDLLERMRIIENDDQVYHLNIQKYWDKKKPRIEIEVVSL